MDWVVERTKALYASTAAIAQSHIRWGQNIYRDDWDLLVVLDACRVDALQEVQEEYDFIGDIATRWSRGSTSKEWMENTFVEKYQDEIESTIYVTPNPFSSHLINSVGKRVNYTWTEGTYFENSKFLSDLVRNDLVTANKFCEFIDLWHMLDDDDITQLHPKKVTNYAIYAGRQNDCQRQIVHYMQPHRPYLTASDDAPWKTHPFGYLRDGGDSENVWTAYINNLRLVLNYVETLLTNVDAEKVIITSDHGELFGEWGLYSHEVGIPHPALRKVPWTETNAVDTESYKPKISRSDRKASDEVIQERLEALGYQ